MNRGPEAGRVDIYHQHCTVGHRYRTVLYNTVLRATLQYVRIWNKLWTPMVDVWYIITFGHSRRSHRLASSLLLLMARCLFGTWACLWFLLWTLWRKLPVALRDRAVVVLHFPTEILDHNFLEKSWWHNDIKTLSQSLDLPDGNPPVPMNSPHTQTFRDAKFWCCPLVCLNKLLNK